jgi:2-iminobutanoate/2-iminopropanoate deaminase
MRRRKRMAGSPPDHPKSAPGSSRKPPRKSSPKLSSKPLRKPLSGGTDYLRTVHHEGYDAGINSLFVPAIKVEAGKLVFISGMTCAPTYHQHPHRPEDFDAIPGDAAGQAVIAYRHLGQALKAAGCEPSHVVSLTRFLTHLAEDQDAINRVQGEFFNGHLPTSTTVEVKRMATDPRIRLEIQAIAVAPA